MIEYWIRVEWAVDSEEEYELSREASQLPGEIWSLIKKEGSNE